MESTYYINVTFGGYELHQGLHTDFDTIENQEEIVGFADETWMPIFISLDDDQLNEIDSRVYPSYPAPKEWLAMPDTTLVRVECEASFSFDADKADFNKVTFNNHGAIFYNDVRLDCDDCEGIFRSAVIEQ